MFGGEYNPYHRWDPKGTHRTYSKERELAWQGRSRRGQEEEMVCFEHRGNRRQPRRWMGKERLHIPPGTTRLRELISIDQCPPRASG